jgi:hypothetical protein
VSATYCGLTAANYTNSTAIGSGATITASNQIVLGTASEKVVIPNQIQYSYTSVPTLTSTSIGYNVTSGAAGVTITAPTDLYKVTPVAGVYIFNIDATLSGPNPGGNYTTNLYLQKAGVTQIYTVKGWAGAVYNFADTPMSLTGFLSVDGTQEVKFYITTATSVIVTYYAKHMRIA